MSRRRPTAGWSRTPIPVTPDMVVLDLGSGAFPNPAATILCDRDLDDDRHRAGAAVVIDRPLVRADASALPFRDKAVDFVVASHIAEHVDDPAGLCRELARVAWAGYVETPSPLADALLDEEYHIWRVGRRGDVLTFATKRRPRNRVVAAVTEVVYRVFYAGEAHEAHPPYRLPGGPLGRVLGFVLLVGRGALNRSGLMHTRFLFGPGRPLRAEVDGRRPS